MTLIPAVFTCAEKTGRGLTYTGLHGIVVPVLLLRRLISFWTYFLERLILESASVELEEDLLETCWIEGCLELWPEFTFSILRDFVNLKSGGKPISL